MTRTRRRPAEQLRLAVECLPIETKRAMLAGIRDNTIIVGAYTDRSGGICPMLAAHRNGGRTSFALFARAWDRYTGVGSRSRKATEREVRTLTTMLEASVAGEDGFDLGTVVEEHRAAMARRTAERPRRPDTGERDRSRELRRRSGWAWLRPFRRYDEYQAALDMLEGVELQSPVSSDERPRERELV